MSFKNFEEYNSLKFDDISRNFIATRNNLNKYSRQYGEKYDEYLKNNRKNDVQKINKNMLLFSQSSLSKLNEYKVKLTYIASRSYDFIKILNLMNPIFKVDTMYNHYLFDCSDVNYNISIKTLEKKQIDIVELNNKKPTSLIEIYTLLENFVKTVKCLNQKIDETLILINKIIVVCMEVISEIKKPIENDVRFVATEGGAKKKESKRKKIKKFT